MNKKSPKHKLHSLSLGLNSPKSPAKKKNEQFLIRKEKSKSNIQVIMDEIYQESGGKNSKIVKYLTQMSDFHGKSPQKTSLLPKFYRKIPKSMVNSLFSPKNEARMSTKLSTKAIKTTTSIDISDNPPQKNRRLDLEIEDPDIINIYQSSLNENLNKKINFPYKNSNFDEELRKKLKEMRMFVLQNTDILTKIKQKEHKTAQSKLNIPQEKHKKHINIKEESIKKRFFRFWTQKNADKLEKNDSFVNLKETNSQKNLLTVNESPHRKNTHNSRTYLTKVPYDIKSRLKDSIKENRRVSVKKLTNIEKLMEKYTFTGSGSKRIDMEILNNLTNSSNSKGFMNFNLNSNKSTKTLAKFIVNEEIKPVEKTAFQKNQSPKQKFDLFYNDLMKYYKSEMIEKDSFEKNIDYQVKTYDDELKKINEQLFEFNADLDKDFNKEIVEGKLIKFSSIRRTKRKI